MKQSLRQVETRLRSERLPEPPPELVGLLKSEIPQRTETGIRESARGNQWFGRAALLAASVAVTIVGLSIAYRVSRPALEREAVETASAFEVQERQIIQEARERLLEPLAEPAESIGPSATIEAPQPKPANVPVAEVESDRASAVVPLTADTAKMRAQSEPAPSSSSEPKPELREETGVMARRSLGLESRVQREPAPAPMEGFNSLQRVPDARLYSSPLAAAPSTGGTAEPNDQPYGDMFFKSAGVNPFVDTEDDALSTFGLDVDTGSYTLVRSYLERGHLPPAESVRVEEFVNYFDFGDAPPVGGDFAVVTETAPTPFGSGERYQLMRVGIRGREVESSQRAPATLIFVVDVSGSMAREDRLGLVKKSLFLLLDQLHPNDQVGLVVYGARGRVLLEPTSDLEAIRSAVDRLQSEGSTNAEEGLLLGYQLAEQFFRPGAIHRIVLCSDGVANVGRTGPDSILERIGEGGERGIELSTVGFGMGNYNDVLMEQLADRGDGNYAYVDGLAEARRVFVENLTGMLQTIASEARVQVEFDPEVVERYRLLGYENRDIADERFRDDTVDAGEIGAGHSVTALYEIKLAEAVKAREVLATVRLRYYSKAAKQFVELEHSS
jgi:Ca-activated chloride channel family protein